MEFVEFIDSIFSVFAKFFGRLPSVILWTVTFPSNEEFDGFVGVSTDPFGVENVLEVPFFSFLRVWLLMTILL